MTVDIPPGKQKTTFSDSKKSAVVISLSINSMPALVHQQVSLRRGLRDNRKCLIVPNVEWMAHSETNFDS